MSDVSNRKSLLGLVGAAWGVLGFAAILLDAIIRLAGIALQAFDMSLSWYHYVTAVAVVIAMAYAEGYRGFQKSFSPRCAARALHLYRHPDLKSALLAPAFLMGFFRATRAPFLFAWVGTALIILLIVLLQISPQPWRGIVDSGVVAGLSWGLASFLVSVWQTFRSGEYPLSPEVPGK